MTRRGRSGVGFRDSPAGSSPPCRSAECRCVWAVTAGSARCQLPWGPGAVLPGTHKVTFSYFTPLFTYTLFTNFVSFIFAFVVLFLRPDGILWISIEGLHGCRKSVFAGG